MIALDIAEHFKEKIRPNGFKAQVVAPSRRAALAYARYLRDFGIGETYPIITVTAEDGNEFKAARAFDRRQIVNAFVDDPDGPEILVVVDMLLTGFDAPVEQALYLDKHLQEHNLLQAIARVNRTYTHEKDGVTTHKHYGLVIDYHGVSQNLERAPGRVRLERCRQGDGPAAGTGAEGGGCDRGGRGQGRIAFQGVRPGRPVGVRGGVRPRPRHRGQVQGGPLPEV